MHLRTSLLALALLWSGCDSCLPESWRVPEQRRLEIHAIELHSHCVRFSPCGAATEKCHRDSEAYCLSIGLTKSCGDEEIEGSCGEGIR